jgi:hypothetical protein
MTLYVVPYRWVERGRRFVLYLPLASRAAADRFRARAGIR